jgi:hypothetical protein
MLVKVGLSYYMEGEHSTKVQALLGCLVWGAAAEGACDGRGERTVRRVGL